MTSQKRKYRDPGRKDWIRGIANLVLFVVVITLESLLLFTDYWYLWLILVVGGVGILVFWQTKSTPAAAGNAAMNSKSRS